VVRAGAGGLTVRATVRALVRSLPLVALAGFTLAAGVRAQSQYSVEVIPGAAAPDPLAAQVPFGPGERLEYQVKLGIFSAGSGFMAVEGVDTVRAQPAYRLALQLKGGLLFAKVDDKYKSWLTTRDLISLHFIKDVKEVTYKSFKEWAIYPEERRWQQLDENHAEPMDATEPLDELSMLYWIRTLPLTVGETYTLNRYFMNKSNPVVIKVLRKERKKVPAGEFDCIVVQPLVKSGGLFGEGGKAELFFTDDMVRHLVYMRSELPGIQSITLHLRRVQTGTPLFGGATTGAAQAGAPGA
jgi:hypothetical protein